MKTRVLLFVTALSLFIVIMNLHAQGTAFTYQGRLNDGANPADGKYDLTFTLFSVSNGAGQVGSPLNNDATAVSNGLFTVALDFGNQFPGAARWLEIGVRSNGMATFTTLAPRQPLTPAPYAIYAESANASNLVGTIPAANLSGAALLAGGNTFSGTQNINDSIDNNVLSLSDARSSIIGAGPQISLFDNFSGSPESSIIGSIGNGGGFTWRNGALELRPVSRVNIYKGFEVTSPSQVALTVIGSSGNVGIGTAAPVATLEVNGNAQIDGTITATGFSGNGSGLTNLNQYWSRSGSNISYAAGNVGIGTTTPAAGLEVETFSPVSAGNWSYFQLGTINAGSFIGLPNVAIYTSGAMGASTYYAFSDARIKNIIGVSSGDKDLNTLRAIEVTDYTYKDTVANGSRQVKKVIAQQVESVYPQAVSRTTGVVPDIYEQAAQQDGWVKLATNFKVGERVKLVGENGQGIYEVLETREGAFRTGFRPATEKVFVFGREVKDFRNVDYEAITTLNVSATQELARKLETENAELKHRVERLERLLERQTASR